MVPITLEYIQFGSMIMEHVLRYVAIGVAAAAIAGGIAFYMIRKRRKRVKVA